jgi:lipoyl-dependent peroxiredoxin
MQRNASAHWEGGIKQGHGFLSTDSGALESRQYSFDSRFQGGQGTNPEELIGAAHAGCFSMALAKVLDDTGHHADRIDTQAGVELEQVGDGFGITRIHLNCTAEVPGLDNVRFEDAAAKAKENCPISQLLNAEVSLDARLVG